MTMTLRHSLVVLAATALTFSLAACGMSSGGGSTPIADSGAAPTPTTTDTTAADPTDAPVPAVASGERPDPAADIVCNDLTDPAQLDPVFAVPVNLAPPTRTFEYVGAQIADEWIIRQGGGVACQWSDPEGISTSEGRYLAGMDLRLVRASGPQWQEFSDAQGDGSDRRFVCDDYGNCDYDRYFSSGWWLSLSAFNIDALSSPTASALRTLTSPVFSSIASTVASLPAPGPAWAPPVPDVRFGGGCAGVITGARLRAAVGMSGAATLEEDNYPRAAKAALDAVGGTDCRWSLTSPDFDVIYIQSLPGGAWAQAEQTAAMEANGASVPSPAVPGVPAGATSYFEHVDSSSLDIVLGGSWVKISIGHGTNTGALSEHAALIAIAADIAAHAS
ncbi:MAG TPA: hypothetical protein VGO65_06970 [Pseudolysinimonas sp.]|nr:hypothetical protein [Pseudolysinimonas sp.]